jgi:hypothetical protein
MRKLLPALVAGLALVPTGAARDQPDEARALVERAVKAMGGLENLTKAKAAHYHSRGRFPVDGYHFTSECFSESSERIKLTTLSLDSDNPMFRTLVLLRDRGWIVHNGVLQDLDEEMMEQMRKARYSDRVAGLVTLLRDPGYTLTPLGETRVKDAAALGVKVTAAGRQEINLYFDRESGLLVKQTRMVKDYGSGKEVLQEMYFLDYQWVNPAASDEQRLQAARQPVDGPGLVKFLQDRTPTEQTRERVRTLVAKLGDPSYRVRERSTAEIKKLGLAAAPLLREALQHADREVSRRARLCLDQLTDHPDAALIRSAVRLLALRRPPATAAALLAYLPWAPDDTMVEEIKEALAAVAVRDGQPDPVVVQALTAPDPACRAAAAAVLGRDGGAYARQAGRRVVIEGLRLSNRVLGYRAGQLHMELETTEREFLNRLDDSLFAHPQ